MPQSCTTCLIRYRALVILILALASLLVACAGLSPSLDPAGTSTQDPPIPQLTEATRGILDTTGTVPQSFIEQLRSQSDEVQAHGYQIAVVFFNNLASDPHQFATQVFNTNRIEYARGQLINEQTDFNKWLLTQIPMNLFYHPVQILGSNTNPSGPIPVPTYVAPTP
ncbi:MAG TPA: hypothetical protein VKY19_08475 [Ktedonosporobacter sp.]|nr:hypothetical protein [Ktedonosporobacter sp.]